MLYKDQVLEAKKALQRKVESGGIRGLSAHFFFDKKIHIRHTLISTPIFWSLDSVLQPPTLIQPATATFRARPAGSPDLTFLAGLQTMRLGSSSPI